LEKKELSVQTSGRIMKGKARGHILVVEDDADSSSALCMLFRLEGFEVRVAVDGRDAYRLSLADKPDLVVTDLGMPGMGGIDLIRAFKVNAALSEVPIIAVSADEKRQLRSATEWGAVAVYQKPLDFERLLSTVIFMLASKGAKHEVSTFSSPMKREPQQNHIPGDRH
jgi:DNA-binding response OmpR family regulator